MILGSHDLGGGSSNGGEGIIVIGGVRPNGEAALIDNNLARPRDAFSTLTEPEFVELRSRCLRNIPERSKGKRTK